MSRTILAFIAGSLIVTAATFTLIVGYTPLSAMQILGTAAAFAIGWIGLAFAGSDAIRNVIRRRFTWQTAERRGKAFVRSSQPASPRSAQVRQQPLVNKTTERSAAVAKRLTFNGDTSSADS